MSKARQRRQSAYAQGLADANKKFPFFAFRRSHPLYSQYRKGWNDATNKRYPKVKRKLFNFNNLFLKLFKRWRLS